MASHMAIGIRVDGRGPVTNSSANLGLRMRAAAWAPFTASTPD